MAEALKLYCYQKYSTILFLLMFIIKQSASQNDAVTYLQASDRYECCRSADERSDLKVFCYKGQSVHSLRMFQSAFIELQVDSDKYQIYEGGSADEVRQQYITDQSVWSLSSLWGSPKKREIQLKPFNITCIGLNTRQNYSLQLILLRISYYRLIVLCTGIILFVAAPNLSRNVGFHYIGGISVGVLASLLVLMFLLSKLLPKKPIMLSMMAAGWVVTAYMLNLAWDNLRHILTEYKTHLAGYVVLSSVLSFIICYRMGPVSNPRTMNLIQWSLQIIGLILVLCCSHYQEATVSIVIILLSIYNFPQSWAARIGLFWHRCFPPKRRLLTMAEYEHEGTVETEKALKQLREFCSTPESNPWKLQLQLKDPVRFAKFVQGDSHLSDEELMGYDVIANSEEDLLTDDEDY